MNFENLPPMMIKNLEHEPHFFAALDGQRTSLATLCGRVSHTRRCAFQICFTSFRVREVYTVSSLLRLLQMGAAIGWLQRNSRRSEEGRVSWPGRRRNSSRSSEGRILGSRIGQRTVVQWLSADSGAASAFQRMLGAQRVPDAFCSVRRPDAYDTV